MHRFFVTAALCAVLFSASRGTRQAALAGTALRMDVEELVGRAALVVEARVLSGTAAVAANGRIDTEFTLAVDRTFLGADESTRVVRLPGGVLPDGSGMIVPGMARLTPGEDVILMLTEESVDGARLPVGLGQGKFRIFTDRFGHKTAVRAQDDMALANPVTSALREADALSTANYAELVARIHGAVATRRALEAGEGR